MSQRNIFWFSFMPSLDALTYSVFSSTRCAAAKSRSAAGIRVAVLLSGNHGHKIRTFCQTRFCICLWRRRCSTVFYGYACSLRESVGSTITCCTPSTLPTCGFPSSVRAVMYTSEDTYRSSYVAADYPIVFRGARATRMGTVLSAVFRQSESALHRATSWSKSCRRSRFSKFVFCDVSQLMRK
jgi:hypothetical protein